MRLANDPTTSQRTLVDLARGSDSASYMAARRLDFTDPTVVAAARNDLHRGVGNFPTPNTSQLVGEYIRSAAVTPDDLAHAATNTDPLTATYAASRLQDADQQQVTLAQWADRSSGVDSVVHALLGNPNLDPDVREDILTHPNPVVRGAAVTYYARHDPDLSDRYAADSEWGVRATVAGVTRNNTVLVASAHDTHPSVRYQALTSRHLTSDSLRQITTAELPDNDRLLLLQRRDLPHDVRTALSREPVS